MCMRILLVAPNQPGLNSVPEIRALSDMHRVSVLNGTVTVADVYDAARHSPRDIIHFAAHSTPDAIQLSDGVLSPEDVAQIARITGAKLVFFNSCLSARHAAYAVSHGVTYAISTTVEISDVDAWRTPLAFYEALAEQRDTIGTIDYAAAFGQADSGNGNYALSVSISNQSNIEVLLAELRGLHNEVSALRQDNDIQRRVMVTLLVSNVAVWAGFIYLWLLG